VRHRQAEPAVRRTAERDVGHREAGTADERAAGELGVEDLQQRQRRARRAFGRGRVALRFGRAHALDECVAHFRRQLGALPVHPAVGIGALGQRLRRQAAAAMLGREVAHDRIRFPQHEAVVGYARHHAVRIQLQVFGAVDDAVRETGVDSLVAQPKLVGAPNDFLDIDRTQAAPDLQHRRLFFVAQTPTLARPQKVPSKCTPPRTGGARRTRGGSRVTAGKTSSGRSVGSDIVGQRQLHHEARERR
jgi:hypothetical protein